MSAPVLGMRQYSSSQGRGAENTARNEDFPALAELWIFPAIRYMARPTSWLSNPLHRPPPFFLARFPFFQTNNLQINGHNYLWPPQLRTTAIKLINRGRLSVSPDCCVIRGAINKAVLLPCDILQMVWQQLLLLQPHGSIYPHHHHHHGGQACRRPFSPISFVPLQLFLAMCRLKD